MGCSSSLAVDLWTSPLSLPPSHHRQAGRLVKKEGGVSSALLAFGTQLEQLASLF